MNAFEQIIEKLLRQEGYWTRIGYKVNLTPAMKKVIGIPSMPRPEFDILAYKPSRNELLWVECKSYLDSRGVIADAVTGIDEERARGFNVFTNRKFRDITTRELLNQMLVERLFLQRPNVNYCLVAGKIASETDRERLREYFTEKIWILYDDGWIKSKLADLTNLGYEDDESIIVAKLFQR